MTGQVMKLSHFAFLSTWLQVDWGYVFELTTTKVVAASTKQKRATIKPKEVPHLTYEEVVGRAGLRTMKVCFFKIFLRAVCLSDQIRDQTAPGVRTSH